MFASAPQCFFVYVSHLSNTFYSLFSNTITYFCNSLNIFNYLVLQLDILLSLCYNHLNMHNYNRFHQSTGQATVKWLLSLFHCEISSIHLTFQLDSHTGQTVSSA